jgi:2-succinyl-5-enolpyruvyl-6-hydroxy-3-cyclohexene-1-carboxylate synthase
MYSDKKSVLQLAALLKAYGVRHIVVSPGSRNSPLTHTFAHDPFFDCHIVVDERSAGFYASGIILATGIPAAVCCTSGTAALNLAPAVAEAFYANLPLIAITADRPAARVGQADGQTIPQPDLFHSLSVKSVSLPEIGSKEDEWYCNRLINEALLASERMRQPVHINVPLSEPLFACTTAVLPNVRKITRCSQRAPISEMADFGKRAATYRKRMIIVGQLPDGQTELRTILAKLAENGYVILAEHLSNINASFLITGFDALLARLPDAEKHTFAPDLLITLGGAVVSKQIRQFLRRYPPAEHWDITPSGEVRDAYQCLTHILETQPTWALGYLLECGSAKETNRQFVSHWKTAAEQERTPAVLPYSDMLAVRELLAALPAHSALHLSNSLSVRLAQLFPLPPDVSVYSNRGTSGIDGCLSTAVGYASASSRLTFLLIGDLAFFYDMNVLRDRASVRNLRVMLNNNGGGGIFHTLPGMEASSARNKYIVAAHNNKAEAWAKSQGFMYYSVANEHDLYALMPVFAGPAHEKPMLMEVFTKML